MGLVPNTPAATNGNGTATGSRFVCNRYHQTSSLTNMMAGLDWEPIVNRRGAFHMFMFYKMHSGLVAIHPTLYLTPRQYHTSHKYYIPHSRINQHAFSVFQSTVRLWNKLPATTAQARSLTPLRPGWRHCKQNHFNSTTHTCTNTHIFTNYTIILHPFRFTHK